MLVLRYNLSLLILVLNLLHISYIQFLLKHIYIQFHNIVSLKILYSTVSSDHLIEITRWQTVTENLHTEDDDTLHLFGTD